MVNTLAYYYTATIIAVKSFIVQTSRVDVIKLFTSVNYECSLEAIVFVLAWPFLKGGKYFYICPAFVNKWNVHFERNTWEVVTNVKQGFFLRCSYLPYL